MADQDLAIRIRLFLRNLFGSRLVATLDEQAMRTRADFAARLTDKDEIITDLRSRVSILQMKLEAWELRSPIGNILHPGTPRPVLEPPIETGWRAIQNAWAKKQEEEVKDERVPVEISQ